jgi:hypothetical protein
MPTLMEKPQVGRKMHWIDVALFIDNSRFDFVSLNILANGGLSFSAVIGGRALGNVNPFSRLFPNV